MTDPNFRLAEAPVLSLNAPDCGTCEVSVESDGDGWTCPNCWSTWSYDQGDGDVGQLHDYEDPDALPLVDPDDAWRYDGLDDAGVAALNEDLAKAAAAPESERDPHDLRVGPQCLDLSGHFDLADIVKARDEARAAKPRPDAPLVVSPRDAAVVTGTPAEGGTVVSVQIVQNGADLPPLTPTPAFPRDPRRPASPTSAFLSPRFTMPGQM